MAEEIYDEEFSQEELDALGDVLVVWEVDEYPHFQRSMLWHLVVGIVALLLIGYAIFSANFLFAIIILMVGVIILVTSFKAPEKVDVAVTTTGVIIEDTYYDWKHIKDFSIVYEPPHIQFLYLDFKSVFSPMVAIPIDEVDPVLVRESLLPFAKENLERDDETLTDLVRRLYKI